MKPASLRVVVLLLPLLSCTIARAEPADGKQSVAKRAFTTSQPSGSATTQPTKIKIPYPSASDRLSGLFLNPNYATERRWDFSHDSGWRKAGRFAGNLGWLLLGAATAMASHELAHFVMSKALGVPFKWPVGGFDGPLLPTWRVPPDESSSSQRGVIAASGFFFHVLLIEACLAIPAVPKDNLFVTGFLLMSILNNLFYPLTDALFVASRGVGYGDIQLLRESGVPAASVSIPLIMHSVIALVRLVFLSDDFKRRFNPWAKPRTAGADIVMLRW